MQPVVSIILPTFGRLQYLRPTVASVYRQTLRDWELIVADDGSDRETRGYLRTLEADSRVKLLWLTHTGIPALVRNAALREARRCGRRRGFRYVQATAASRGCRLRVYADIPGSRRPSHRRQR